MSARETTLKEIAIQTISADIHAHPSRVDSERIKRLEELIITMAGEIDRQKQEVDKLKVSRDIHRKTLIHIIGEVDYLNYEMEII